MYHKKIISICFSFLYLSFASACFALTATPVTGFDDWGESYPGQFAHSGNSTTLTTDTAGNISKSITDAIGVISSVNFISSTGSTNAGIGMSMGVIDGYRVQVNFSVSKWGDYTSTYYRIQTRDAQNNTVEELAYGGQTRQSSRTNIVIGMARIGNEVWLYADGFSLMKWDPLVDFGTNANHVWLWGSAVESLDSSLQVQFSDVQVLKP